MKLFFLMLGFFSTVFATEKVVILGAGPAGLYTNWFKDREFGKVVASDLKQL